MIFKLQRKSVEEGVHNVIERICYTGTCIISMNVLQVRLEMLTNQRLHNKFIFQNHLCACYKARSSVLSMNIEFNQTVNFKSIKLSNSRFNSEVRIHWFFRRMFLTFSFYLGYID